MPGSVDSCPCCGKIFFGKQKFLRCSRCSVRSHVTCLKLKPDEINDFQKNGNFICRDECTNLCLTCGSACDSTDDVLACSRCLKKSHVDCLNITQDELSIYLQGNNFKCLKCLNNKLIIADNTPVKSACLDNVQQVEQSQKIESSDDDSTSGSDLQDQKSVASKKDVHQSSPLIARSVKRVLAEGVHQILNAFKSELASVKEELRLLKDENRLLKESINELSKSTIGSACFVNNKNTNRPNIVSRKLKPGKFNNQSLLCSDVVDSEDSDMPLVRDKPSVNNVNNVYSKVSVNSVFDNNDNVNRLSLHDANIDLDSQITVPEVLTKLDNSPPVLNLGLKQDEAPWSKVIKSSRRRRGSKNLVKVGDGNHGNTEHAGVMAASARKIAQKKVIKLGINENRRNLVCPKKKALFVSRFNPNVTIEDVKDLLKDLQVSGLVCRRLKTKYTDYNSFHVEVVIEDFDKVCKPEVWPRGILVAPFFGPLRKDMFLVDRKPLEDGSEDVRDG